jgi:hypothetical protein
VSWGIFGDLRPLGRSELSLKPVKQLIQHETLPVIEALISMVLPEFCFAEHIRQARFGIRNRAVQAAEKPLHPCGQVDVQLRRCLLSIYAVC